MSPFVCTGNVIYLRLMHVDNFTTIYRTIDCSRNSGIFFGCNHTWTLFTPKIPLKNFKI